MITITQIRFSKNNVVYKTENVNYKIQIKDLENYRKDIINNCIEKPDTIDFTYNFNF